MVDRLLRMLTKLANGRVILGLFLVVAALTFIFFPARARQLKAQTGVDSVFDTRFSYSPQAAANLLEDLGAAGRRQYAASELTLDLLYPLTYGFFLSLAILALYRRAFPDFPAVRRLALLPFAVVLFDLLENISVVVLLQRYPQQLPGLVRAASLFTSLKWSLGALVAIVIFIGLPAWLIAGRNPKVRAH